MSDQEPEYGTFENCEKFDGHVFKFGEKGCYCTDCLTEFDVTFTPRKIHKHSNVKVKPIE